MMFTASWDPRPRNVCVCRMSSHFHTSSLWSMSWTGTIGTVGAETSSQFSSSTEGNFVRISSNTEGGTGCWEGAAVSLPPKLPSLTEQLMASSARNSWSFYHLPLRSRSLKPMCTERACWALLVQSSTCENILLHHSKLLFALIVKGHMVVKYPKLCFVSFSL